MIVGPLAWVVYLPSPAAAQGRGQAAKPKQKMERRHRPRDDRAGPPRDGGRRPGWQFGRFPGANLFRPSPEDEGPLTPDERRELVNFVRKRAPGIHRSLKQLYQRDPEAFEQRLQDAAPRLRQLRRIYRRDPQLGRNIIRHAENLQRIQRARRAWPECEQDPKQRRRIYNAARRLLAENVRIETAVLDHVLLELERRREDRIEAEFERLVSPDADLAGEPPELRNVVRRLRGAQTDDGLQWLEDELREMCSQRMDREIAGLCNRVTRLRANAVEEVDRRMNRLINHNGHGQPPYANPRRGNTRHGDKGRERGRPTDQQP